MTDKQKPRNAFEARATDEREAALARLVALQQRGEELDARIVRLTAEAKKWERRMDRWIAVQKWLWIVAAVLVAIWIWRQQ